MRQEQAKRERRLAKCGEAVAVALAERDAVVSDCEQQAGRALRSLIEEEGLSTQEALAWCGHDTLTGREVYRLIRDVTDSEDLGEDGVVGGVVDVAGAQLVVLGGGHEGVGQEGDRLGAVGQRDLVDDRLGPRLVHEEVVLEADLAERVLPADAPPF